MLTKQASDLIQSGEPYIVHDGEVYPISEATDLPTVDLTETDPTYEDVMHAENPYDFATNYIDSIFDKHDTEDARLYMKYLMINMIYGVLMKNLE